MKMEFNTKIGNYIKSNNNTSKIIKKILLSVFIIYILTFIIYVSENKILFLFNTITICFVNFILEFLYRKLIKMNNDILHILGNSYVLIYSFLISLLLPVDMPFVPLIIVNVFSYIFLKIVDKFFKIKFNYVCFVLFLSILYFNINDFVINIVFPLKINIFLLLFMIIIIAFLTINDSIKWRITITYFVTLLLLIFIYSLYENSNFLNLINVSYSFYGLILATFIINDFKTTSIIPVSQVIYSAFLSIFMFISIEFLNYYCFYMFVLILNFFNCFLDNICIYLKNKNKVLP